MMLKKFNKLIFAYLLMQILSNNSVLMALGGLGGASSYGSTSTASTVSSCPAGQGRSNNINGDLTDFCAPCKVGYFQSGSSIACQICSSNWITTGTGSTACILDPRKFIVTASYCNINVLDKVKNLDNLNTLLNNQYYGIENVPSACSPKQTEIKYFDNTCKCVQDGQKILSATPCACVPSYSILNKATWQKRTGSEKIWAGGTDSPTTMQVDIPPARINDGKDFIGTQVYIGQDPAVGWAKEFVINWQCTGSCSKGNSGTITIKDGNPIDLVSEYTGTATWQKKTGSQKVWSGGTDNPTTIQVTIPSARINDGKNFIGTQVYAGQDPAVGWAKEFVIYWRCTGPCPKGTSGITTIIDGTPIYLP